MRETSFERARKAPLAWLNRANDLRASAAALHHANTPAGARDIVHDYNLGEGFSMPAATTRVLWMLYGMSLEALFKGVVVASGREPQHVHNLAKLATRAGLTMNAEKRGHLAILSHAVIWQGRYPVPNAVKEMHDLSKLVDDHLFDRKPAAGKLFILTPNRSLNWESFTDLWLEASAAFDHEYERKWPNPAA